MVQVSMIIGGLIGAAAVIYGVTDLLIAVMRHDRS